MFFNYFNIIILNTLKISITAFSSIENKYIPDRTQKVNWLILSNWWDLNESSLGDWSGKEKHSKQASYVSMNAWISQLYLRTREGVRCRQNVEASSVHVLELATGDFAGTLHFNQTMPLCPKLSCTCL